MKHHSVAGDVKKNKMFYSTLVFNMKSTISVGGEGRWGKTFGLTIV